MRGSPRSVRISSINKRPKGLVLSTQSSRQGTKPDFQISLPIRVAWQYIFDIVQLINICYGISQWWAGTEWVPTFQ
jgi:hypothetical protein